MFKNIFFKSMAVFLLCILTAPVFAQEKAIDKNDPANSSGQTAKDNTEEEEPVRTLLDTNKMRFSGYGAPVVRFSNIENSLAVFTGGRGGLIINNSLVIGGAGYGMLLPRIPNTTSYMSGIGYGGFLMEYYFFPKNVVNFSIGTIIGAGGGHNNLNSISPFFVLEPEVNVFVNVTQFFRLGVGASYRYTSGMNVGTINDANFRGFSVGLLFEFGRF